MNPSLANFILSKTPDFILHPTKMAETQFTLNTGAKIPALGELQQYACSGCAELRSYRAGNMAIRTRPG